MPIAYHVFVFVLVRERELRVGREEAPIGATALGKGEARLLRLNLYGTSVFVPQRPVQNSKSMAVGPV